MIKFIMIENHSAHLSRTNSEGEFLVNKFGFGRDLGVSLVRRLTVKLQTPQNKFPPNSHPFYNFID